MKQMKRWISLLLVFVMTFSCMSNIAMAEGTEEHTVSVTEPVTDEPVVEAVVETVNKVVVYGRTEDMNTTIAGVTGSKDECTIGEKVTMTAPVVSGYNFLGWYKAVLEGDSIKAKEGKILSRAQTYTVTVESGVNAYVAIYEVANKKATVTLTGFIGTVNYSVNASNEESYTSESSETTHKLTCQVGDSVTLRVATENFIGWQNDYNVYVNRDAEYTFKVIGDITLKPVFNTVTEENSVQVVFESFYRQELSRGVITKTTTDGSVTVNLNDLKIPAIPTRNGYTASGWDIKGTKDSITAENGNLSEAVQAYLTNPANLEGLKDQTITFKAAYKLATSQTYEIRVNNGGTISKKSYKISDIVKLTAVEVPGKYFSHWKNADGNIVSYNPNYSFYAVTNIYLEAVYVENESDKVTPIGVTETLKLEKEDVGDVNDDNGELLYKKEKVTIVSLSTVPSGCKIHKAGVIAALKGCLGDNELTEKTAQAVTGDAWTGTTYRYTLSVTKKSTDFIYARAYLVYEKDGKMYTVYGDVLTDDTTQDSGSEEVKPARVVTLDLEGVDVNVNYTLESGRATEKGVLSADGKGIATLNCSKGDTVTLTAVTLTAGEDCIGWQNEHGGYLDRDTEYTFMVTENVTLKPIIHTVTENSAIVIFESLYGQELERVTVTEVKETIDGDTTVTYYKVGEQDLAAYGAIPEVSTRYGYIAVGWDARVAGSAVKRITAETGKNEDGEDVVITPLSDVVKNYIKDSFAVGATITFREAYMEDESKKVEVTVKNGEKETGTTTTYSLNAVVEVTAEDVEGKVFSHWQDDKESILSYSKEYSFFAMKDITLTAVYVENEEEKTEPEAITEMVEVKSETAGENKNKVTLISLSTVPDDWEIYEAGMLVTTKSYIKENGHQDKELTEKTARAIMVGRTAETTYRYTFTVTKSTSDTVYARAYLTYFDIYGNMHTIYGDVVDENNVIIPSGIITLGSSSATE